MMKRLETLDDVMTYINRKHRKINSKAGGVHGMKMLRKPDGRRIMFEEIKGFRIFKWEILDETTLMLQTLANGFKFRGREKQYTVSSWLHLADLAVISVYDHRASFFSMDSIDFSYIEDDFASELQMLQEWVNDEVGEPRAQWVANDEGVNRILAEVTRDIEAEAEAAFTERRFLDMKVRGCYGTHQSPQTQS